MKWDRKNRIAGSTDMAFCGILIPDEKQAELIRKTLGCKRYIYNQFLDERIKAHNAGLPSISFMEQIKQLDNSDLLQVQLFSVRIVRRFLFL